MSYSQSKKLFAQAKKIIAGGVNSPVRAFSGVGGEPLFFKRGSGAYLYDVDGNRYIDYVNSWGAMILGHSEALVITAIKQALSKGIGFGAPTLIETQLGEKVASLMPSIELLRFVNSGTEATMSAIRLARGYTKRDLIVKFTGCYHGHSDSLLIKAGSGALTFGTPSSAGVPKDLAKYTLTLDYNNSAQITEVFAKIGEQIAAVIVEPVAGNMNCILPEADFLATLRTVCDQSGALLIFDEVMTGFRVALGGAQSRYQIKPDLTTLGKVLGGGFPIGAFGGSANIMEHISPLGTVYQAGTLSGNPIAMTAGLAVLTQLNEDLYQRLEQKAKQLTTGIIAAAKSHHIAMRANVIGAMFGLFFTDKAQPRNFNDSTNCNLEQFRQFFHLMLARGIYLAPSAYEAGFISNAHSEADITKSIAAAEESLKNIAA